MGRGQIARRFGRVLRLGWRPLVTSVLGTYLFANVGFFVAGLGGQALVAAQAAVFSDGSGSVPDWLAVAVWVQGVALTALVGAAASASLLAAVVESTWVVERGEHVRPWVPFRRGLSRVVPVARGVAVAVPALAALTAVCAGLLAGSVVTIPVVALIAAIASLRPGWRTAVFGSRAYRALVAAAAPFGALAVLVCRWALWVPGVVAGDEVRAALRSSRDTFRSARRQVAAPLAVVAVVSLLAVVGAVALSLSGAPELLAALVTLGVLVAGVVSATVLVTLLHSASSGVPAPRPTPEGMRGGRFAAMRRRPAFMATLAVAVLAQVVAVAFPAGFASASTPVIFTVDTLADSPEPTPGECLEEALPCSVRGAFAAAATSPGATMRFSVSGDIELVGPLVSNVAVTVDGAGQRVRLVNRNASAALAFYGAGSVVANIAIDGNGTAGARGVSAVSGGLTVDSVTFSGLRSSGQGAAVSANGELSIVNSTFFDVHGAGHDGGAVFSFDTTVVSHSTFAGHHGGGVSVAPGRALTVTNSVFRGDSPAFNCAQATIVAGNVSNDGSCVDHGGSGAGNVPNSSFLLGALTDNGGPVDTLAPAAGSAVLGAGVAEHCVPVDARGVTRPQAPNPCDAGSYQSEVATTTTVTAEHNPLRFGEDPRLVMQVRNELGAPTGSVAVTVDGGEETVLALDANGDAAFDPGLLPVGEHVVRAEYRPDGELTSSVGTLTLIMERQDAAVGLFVDPPGGYSPAGDPVTLEAQVRNLHDISGPQPSGTVEFRSAGDTVATADIVDGIATAADVALDGGLHSLTARFTGSGEFNEATSAEVLHAVQSSTHVALSVPERVVFGNPFDASVALTPSADPDDPDPTGQVTLRGTHVEASHTLTLAWGDVDELRLDTEVAAHMAAGTWDLWASYAGDSHHMAGSSDPVRLIVEPAAAAVTLAGPGAGTLAGEPAEFTATVTATNTPVDPAGLVRFEVDGVEAGAVPLIDGAAVWSPTDLEVTGPGGASVTATFEPASGNFASATSAPVSHRVEQGTTTTSASAPAAAVTGEGVTVAATVAPVAPSVATPTGTVTFTSGGEQLGTVALVDGVAELTVSDLGLGDHEVVATFDGTASYAASTAPAVRVTVSPAATTLNVAVTDPEPTFGEAVTFPATVAAAEPGGGHPTGEITFRDGATVLGSVPADAGVATLTTSALAAGARSVTVTFTGDDSRYLDSATSIGLQVAKAVPSVTFDEVLPDGRSEFGAPVRATVRVVSPTGSAPTGQVELWWGNGGNVVATAEVIDGVATLVADSMFIGRTILGARYLGDDNHDVAHSPSGSDADLLWHEVTKATPRLEVTTEPSPTPFGEVVHVHVNAQKAAGRVPTGAVRVHLQHTGTTEPTHFDADGHATATLLPAQLGNHPITVTVDGDDWFVDTEAVFAGHEVVRGTTTLTLDAAPASVAPGVPTTFTATVGENAAGYGGVTFQVDGVEVATVPFQPDGTASHTMSFPTTGSRTVTARYNGFGFFHPVSSEPVTVEVPGVALRPLTQHPSVTYGAQAQLEVILASPDGSPLVPHPTGTVRAVVDGTTVAAAPVLPPTGGPQSAATVQLWLPSTLDAGDNDVTITYTGDAVYEPLTHAATVTVLRRDTTVSVEGPLTAPFAGEPVRLSGLVTAVDAPGGALAPSGTLTLGTGATTCQVTLAGGVRGGSCEVVFDAPGTYHVRAQYSGDARHHPSASSTVAVTVSATRARVTMSAPTKGTGVRAGWNDTEPVPVTWSVNGGGAAAPTGRVQVWTHEGRQWHCDESLAGSCQVRFDRPAESAWVEVRYSGDSAFTAVTERVRSRVLGCYTLDLVFGSVRTAPNCGGGRYLHGTRVDLSAPDRAGYTFAGWSFGHRSRDLHDSPVMITDHSLIEPRYAPICATLTIDHVPWQLPKRYPYPAPNCDDPVAPDHTRVDLDQVRDAEVTAGRMRFRVGTEVTLRDYDVRAGDLTARVEFSGDGVGSGDGVTSGAPFVMDRDRTVSARMSVPCRRLVVAAAPGTSTEVGVTRYDISTSRLLDAFHGGRCTRPDGTAGFLPGTEVTVWADPPSGTWVERWGQPERLADHTAPAAPAQVADRPGPLAGGRAAHTFRLPDHDTAITAHTATVTCHPVRLSVRDAVTPGLLDDGVGPAEAKVTTPSNCPSWWLHDNRADRSADGWFLEGTEVTADATQSSARLGWVEGFASPQAIAFHRWTGDLASSDPITTFRVDGPVTSAAEFYIPATCATVTVRTAPAGVGEVIASDTGDECPDRPGRWGSPPTPRAPIGDTVVLAARPPGSLQTIWTVEGPSVVNSEACREREQRIAEQSKVWEEMGRSRAEVERSLMQQGYLPGFTMLRIQEEAEWRAERGYSQETIIGDLQRLGLLTEDGAAVPDRLLPNPCDHPHRDVTMPAGQRAVAVSVEGDTVATAHFCSPVSPSATVIGVDGDRRPATPEELNAFTAVFRSKDSASNCPAPGWFRPNTTVTLGADGVGVPGYRIEGWRLDGVEHPAGPLSVFIDSDAGPRDVEVIVAVACHPLKVSARFGYTTHPLPNCPGVDAARNMFAEGTDVMVTAGENSGWVWQGWAETGTSFNPVLAEMDEPVTLTAKFREKNLGEKIMDSVIDPALNAVGVAAKKAVGGVAYAVKTVAQVVIKDGLLTGLALLGDAIKAGFEAVGVKGAVLDMVHLSLNTPRNVLDGALASFDCVQEWAWGRSVPTVGDVKDAAIGLAKGGATTYLKGVSVDQVIADARGFADRVAAGDPMAMSQAVVGASMNTGGAMTLLLVEDMVANPDKWLGHGEALLDRALDALADQFGRPFTWESSAADAWTSGGDQFLQCLGDKGRSMFPLD